MAELAPIAGHDLTDGAPHPDLRGPVRFLLWLARCQPWRVLAGAVFASLWMVALTLPPYLLSRSIDAYLAGESAGRLTAWAAAVFGAGVLGAWLAISRHRTMARLRIEGNFRLSGMLVRHATSLGAKLAQQVNSGELASLGISDVMGASTSLTVTGPGVGAVVAYLVVGILLLQVSGLLALVALLGVPVLVVVIGPLMSRVIASQGSYRNEQGTLSAQLVDAVAGLRVLNAFGGKARYQQRFDDTSGRLLEQGYGVASVTSWVNAVGVGLPAVFLACVTWLAARMVAAGDISPGELVAVYGYTAALVVPVSSFIEGAGMIGSGVVAARRIIAFLSIEPDDVPSGPPHTRPTATALLSDAETGVSVAPEAFVALVCDSTATATRLVNRLGGLEPSEATWGERALQDCPSAELHRRILVAEPDSEIFAGTIGELVRGHRVDATQDEVRAALQVAGAEDMLAAVGNDLDGWVEDGGMNLSGGQRQRLRLARVVMQRPEVLLANEPTSALDAHTETVVAQRLREERHGLRTLIASTSPVVLAHADVVFFVEANRLVATGTHAELLGQPEYRRLVTRGNDAALREGP